MEYVPVPSSSLSSPSPSSNSTNFWYHDIEECECCLDFWLGPQTNTTKKAIDGDSDCDSGYGSVTPPVETRDSFVIPIIKITPLTNDEMILHNTCVRAAYALRNLFMEPYSTSSAAYTSPYTTINDNYYPSSSYPFSSSSSPASSSTSVSSWSFNKKSKSPRRRSSFSSSTTSIAFADRIPLFPNPTLRPPQEGVTCRIKDTFENRTAWPSFFEEPFTTTPFAFRSNSPFDDYHNGDEEESIYAGIYRGVGISRGGSTTSLGSLRSVASVKGGGGGSANGALFGVGGKRLKKKTSASSLVDEVHPSTLSVVRGLTRPERTAKPKAFGNRTFTTATTRAPRTLVKNPTTGSGLNTNTLGVTPRVQSVHTITTSSSSLMNRWSFAGTTKTGSVPVSFPLSRNEVVNQKEANPSVHTTPTRPSPPATHQQPLSSPVPSTVSTNVSTITTTTTTTPATLTGSTSDSSQPPLSTRVGTVTSRNRQTSTSSSSSDASSDMAPPTIVSATISSRRFVSPPTTTVKSKRFSIEGSGWSWSGKFGSGGGSGSSSGSSSNAGNGGDNGSNGGGSSQPLVYSDTTSWSISSRSTCSSSKTTATTTTTRSTPLVQQSKTTLPKPSPTPPASQPHSSLRASASAVSLSTSSNQSHSYTMPSTSTSARSLLKPTAVSSSSSPSSLSQSTESLATKPTKSSSSSAGYSFGSRSTTSLTSISLNTPNKAASASASSTSLVPKSGGSKFGRGLRNLVGGLYSTAPSAFRL